jgi:hypothetical protein
MASVHELDTARARQKRSSRQAPAAPKQPPDRSTGLSMLSTFDLDNVEDASPDEILAALDNPPSTPDHVGASPTAAADEPAAVAGAATTERVESDEILRELEEHHRRAQPTVRRGAPRGSAELQAKSPCKPAPARRQTRIPKPDAATEAGGRRRRAALTLLIAALAIVTSSAFALSQLSGARPRPSGHAAPLTLSSDHVLAPLMPTGTFTSMAAAITVYARQPTATERFPSKPHRREARPRPLRRHGAAQHKTASAGASTTQPSASASTTSTTPSYTRPPSYSTYGSASAQSSHAASTGGSGSQAHPTMTGAPAGPTSLGRQVGNNCNPVCR